MSARRKLGNEDAAWKEAFKRSPEEFLRFFFPKAAAMIDFSRSIRFLDKELKPITAKSKIPGRVADLLFEAARAGMRYGTSIWRSREERRRTLPGVWTDVPR